MMPAITDGSFLLVHHCTKLRSGHIVFVKHPEFGDIVKRIAHIDINGYFTLSGDHHSSVSSDKMGKCDPLWVIGRIRMIVKPHRT